MHVAQGLAVQGWQFVGMQREQGLAQGGGAGRGGFAGQAPLRPIVYCVLPCVHALYFRDVYAGGQALPNQGAGDGLGTGLGIYRGDYGDDAMGIIVRAGQWWGQGSHRCNAHESKTRHGTLAPMHPKALLDHCTALMAQLLRFEHPADAVLAHYFREQRALGSRERATLADAAYTMLRKKPLLELLARSGSGAKERRLAILAFGGERSFLQAALSDAEKQWLAACDQVADADVLPIHRHNLPQWLAEALQAQVGQRFDALAHSLLQPAPLDVRVNTLTTKRADALQALQQAGLSAQASAYSPWGIRVQGKPHLGALELFRHGHIEVQDEGSQLLALLVDAKRGEMVVDFCAGAGGKTLALGAAMRNTGRLYAFDVSAHRLENLKPRLARSGLSNVHPVAIAHERDERIKRLAGKIDRVLVDAPCSGLGTLRRSPDLKWRQSPQTVQQLAEKQAAIVQSAARLLKPGGRLVYATCSLLPAENEAVAAAFAAAHPQFEAVAVAPLLESLKVPHAATLASPALPTGDGDQVAAAGPYLRLWPDLHGTDGFFAAVWQKKQA